MKSIEEKVREEMKIVFSDMVYGIPKFTIDMQELPTIESNTTININIKRLIPSIYTVEYKNVKKGYHIRVGGNKTIMWLLKYKIGVAFVWALVKLKLVKTVV